MIYSTILFHFKPQEPKVVHRDMLWFKELVKQFKNSGSSQLHDHRNQIIYQVLEHKDIDEASRVNAQAMVHNPLLMSCRISSQEYLTDSRVICQYSANSGLGCIAKDANNQIVGTCIGYPLDVVNQAHNQVSSVRCSSEINSLWDIIIHLLMTTPWHQYGDPSRMLYIDDISVLKRASGRGIGFIGIEVSMVLAERKGFTHAVGVSFNNVIANDLKVDKRINIIQTIDISQITKNGQKVFQNIVNERTRYLRLHIARLKPSRL